MSNQSASNSGQEQSLEGCVTRRETDFYITPENGTPVKLRSNQDLSSAENHNVRVRGNYEKSLGAVQAEEHPNAINKGTNGTPSNSTSNNSSMQTANSNSGSQTATNSGSYANSNNNSTNSTDQDFLVTRVDTLSSTCPANTRR
jgi:hypothetical protein